MRLFSKVHKIKYSRLYFLLFILSLSYSIKAQFPNPLDFNTATNATNTGTLPIGTNDLNWSAALTNSLGPYVPAVVCGNQGPTSCCWINSPFTNANWISYPHTCTPGDHAEHSCLPGNQDIFYKLGFNLPASSCGQAITTPSTYCLSFDFYSDNCVYEIFVNGILNYLSPSTNSYYYAGYNSSGGVSISLCNNWQPGPNNVIIHVRSGQNPPPTWEALLAQTNQTLNTTVGTVFNGTLSQTNVSCNGGSNGSATVTGVGGSPPYNYTWFPSGGNTAVASGLSAGNYSVTVTSGNCSFTKTITITQPPAFSITASSSGTVCNGSPATLNANGANSYTWSTGATGASILVNTSGTFTVTGSNSSGCTTTNTVNVPGGPSPTINITGNTTICSGLATTLTANGANSYTWNTGIQSASINAAPAITTVYTVTGNSAGLACNGTQTVSVTVNQPPVIVITGPNSICIGNSALLTANGANTFTWSTGAVTNTIGVNPLTSTNYTVSGTNTLTGCTGTLSFAVVVNSLPQLAVVAASLCPGQSTVVSVSGANTYTWSNGAFSANAAVNAPGIYTVTGTNSSTGCDNTETVSVSPLTLPTISINGLSSVCMGQTLVLVANGASSYTWNTGLVSSSITETNVLQSSSFTVSGIDNLTGCANTQTFAVTVNPLPTLLINGSSIICNNTPVMLSVTGADTYSWSEGSATSTITVHPPFTTSYSVTGTNTLTNCKNTEVMTVTVSSIPVLNVSGGSVCKGQPLLLGASGAISYLWSTGEITNTIVVSPFVATVYTVTGYGTSTLCNITRTAQVNILAAPMLTINSNFTGICKGKSVVLSVEGANTFLWSDGQTTGTIVVSPLVSTVYSVSATETLTGCSNTKSVQVIVYDLPDVKIIGDTNLCDGEKTTLIATGANSYLWPDGVTTNSIEITINENALYLLSGTNLGTGCSNTDSIRVGNSEKCCEIFIPNSFTPNADAVNEDFGPVTLCEFKEYKMYIFNKWGELIFTTNDLKIKWNGFYKGVLSKPDVYVYLIRAKRNSYGIKPYFEKTGHVSLIR